MTRLTLPPWRSLLYVPAHRETFITKAAQRGADAIILDLEDGVPEAHKVEARSTLAASTELLRSEGVTVLLRINRPWSLAWHDLEAALAAGINTVLIPKVETTSVIETLHEILHELEGASHPKTTLIVLIESARGLQNAAEVLSASSRIAAVIPGNEDLAAEFQIEPSPENMLNVQMPLILAARAHGVDLYGLIGSGANFGDLGAYRTRANFAKSWGFRGASCIHPAQVGILNEVFQASEAELKWAHEIVEAFESAGREAVDLQGKMIDLPIYLRAQQLLQQS